MKLAFLCAIIVQIHSLFFKTAGEEELQLQLALAMSREEHEQVSYYANVLNNVEFYNNFT